ncbi:hypothetical protein [Spiroplasma endosymbiont of Nephrotoma flavescens]|uniref:hypothetical protein n=1 Tax=Spiroplasma endosymbiont of Nephrotoma flavescens TaxID=3066302 RepID=UPI00313C2293
MKNIENIFLNTKKYLLKETQYLLKRQKFRDLINKSAFGFQSDLFIKENMKIQFALE